MIQGNRSKKFSSRLRSLGVPKKTGGKKENSRHNIIKEIVGQSSRVKSSPRLRKTGRTLMGGTSTISSTPEKREVEAYPFLDSKIKREKCLLPRTRPSSYRGRQNSTQEAVGSCRRYRAYPIEKPRRTQRLKKKENANKKIGHLGSLSDLFYGLRNIISHCQPNRDKSRETKERKKKKKGQETRD